uniref:Uncharacterized protein n=1 Tax=Lactuca sativa TaxID=4236 RepID=A0A9R1VR71_LACSA|nr:hypothetical protein LSAT_V11C400171270 [Lactuca sativa]
MHLQRLYFCSPREIGVVLKTHLRVVSIIFECDRSSDYIILKNMYLGLWELCCLSRLFRVLIVALHSVKELNRYLAAVAMPKSRKDKLVAQAIRKLKMRAKW